jgi:hypothetical protein
MSRLSVVEAAKRTEGGLRVSGALTMVVNVRSVAKCRMRMAAGAMDGSGGESGCRTLPTGGASGRANRS